MPSPAHVEEIFAQMESYVITLEADPTSLGPRYFQNLIAECRNYLNQASLVSAELTRERLTLSTEIRGLEAAYQLEYDDLLATDEDVRKLSAIEDRKSTVQHMLRSQRQGIDASKEQLHVAEAVGKVVALRSKELNATMTAIRDQRRLIDSELKTGAFYGDERSAVPKKLQHSEPTGGMGIDDDLDLDALISDAADEVAADSKPEVEVDIEALVEEVVAEIAPPVVDEVKADPPLLDISPAEAEVLKFLDPPVSASASGKTEEEDLTDFLDSIV